MVLHVSLYSSSFSSHKPKSSQILKRSHRLTFLSRFPIKIRHAHVCTKHLEMPSLQVRLRRAVPHFESRRERVCSLPLPEVWLTVPSLNLIAFLSPVPFRPFSGLQECRHELILVRGQRWCHRQLVPLRPERLRYWWPAELQPPAAACVSRFLLSLTPHPPSVSPYQALTAL